LGSFFAIYFINIVIKVPTVHAEQDFQIIRFDLGILEVQVPPLAVKQLMISRKISANGQQWRKLC